MSSQIIAGDASNGIQLTRDVDGTLIIQTGAVGAKVNALSLAADGTPTFLKVPVNAAVQSMVRVNTGAGYGGTDSTIERFSNVTNGVNGCVIQGADITVADSAAAATTFTVNTNGVYAISASSGSTGVADNGISLNATAGERIISIASVSLPNRLIYTTTAINNLAAYTWCGYLPAGSILRMHTNATTQYLASLHTLTITRIA